MGAIVPELAGGDLVSANAVDGLMQNLVFIVGPALGAAIIALRSLSIVFGVNAASFAVSALLIVRSGVRSRSVGATATATAGLGRRIAAGAHAILSVPATRVFVGFSVLAGFVYGTDTVLLVAVSRLRLGTGAHGLGYLLAGLGVGGVFVAPAIDWLARSIRPAVIVVGATAVHCLPTALLALVHAPVAAFAVQVVRGAGSLVLDVLAITATQRGVPSHMVSRAFGAFWMLGLAAISIGAAAAPPLVHEAGLAGALLVLALGPTLAALAAYPALAHLDRTVISDVDA
jgi:hypothetical protein